MIDVMAAPMDPRPPEDKVRAMVQMISKRCEEDRWSPEAKRCLADYKTEDDARVCATLLSDDQQAALAREGDKLGGEANERKRTPEQDAEGGAGVPGGGIGGGPKALDEGTLGTKDPQSTGAQPPPPPPPPGGTRGGKPKDPRKTADPCDGGE